MTKESKSEKDTLDKVDPKDKKLDDLANIEKTSKDLDRDVKETNKGANDLIKLLAEIQSEIDDFNKNARKGVLQQILERLKH